MNRDELPEGWFYNPEQSSGRNGARSHFFRAGHAISYCGGPVRGSNWVPGIAPLGDCRNCMRRLKRVQKQKELARHAEQ